MFKTTAEDTLQFQSNPRSALHTAAVNGNLEEVQRLVETGIALDGGDPFGRTALWGAAKSGHKSIIRFLLENGSCASIPDCEGVKPIAIAAKEGQWGAVNEILEHGPKILRRDAECLNTPLHKASESGDLEALRIILKSPINVDSTNEIGSTALHVAAQVGHKEICRMLLKSGASLNAADKNGKTPLTLAAAKGFDEIVREILSAAPVTDLSKSLLSAAAGGHIEVVRELLNHGVGMNITNETGATPLTLAAAKGRVEVVTELLNRGAEVDITDANGSTPLSAAASRGHLGTVRELLKYGASVDIADKDGRTPLLRAASEGHEQIVRELLNRGAKVDITDEFGSTPLSAAATKGHLETVRELLKHGAGVDIADKDRRTPLFRAALEGHEDVLLELLDHGARVDITDAYGNTPLSAAASNMAKGREQIIRELALRSPEQTYQMEYPEEERLPGTEEEQPEPYRRVQGAAGVQAVHFEHKFYALIFLRMKNKGYKFKVAPYMEGLGAFDNVFVEYLDDNSRKNHIFVQLKLKKRGVIRQQLLAEKGDFSLRKYYESYIHIEKKFNCSEEGVKLGGSIDESLFIIYTNADVAEELKSKNVPDIGEAEFLMTGGSVLQFNEEEHKDIYKNLQDLPKHREFLSRFRIIYSQTHEREMDSHIKRELKEIMKLSEIQLDIAYRNFYEYISDWCNKSHFFLQDTNSRENDPLRKTSEYLRSIFGAKNRIRGNPNLTNSI